MWKGEEQHIRFDFYLYINASFEGVFCWIRNKWLLAHPCGELLFYRLNRGLVSIKISKIIIFMVVLLLTSCSPAGSIPEHIRNEFSGLEITRLSKYETGSIKGAYIIDNTFVIQEVTVQGFKGDIRMLVSINIGTKALEKLAILEHHESEDYGGYLTEGWFLGRFSGKKSGSPLKLVKLSAKAQDEIVAITGATKTSQAVIEGVNQCFENFAKIYEEVE